MSRNDAFLTVFAAILVVFSLVVSIWLPRRNPGFPGRSLRVFVLIAIALVVAMLAAVEVFGEGHHFGEAGGEADQVPETETTREESEGGGGGGTETGGGGAGEAVPAGRELFDANQCATCHTFEAAGSTGTIGPNLDESDVAVEAAAEQIRTGGNGMPAFEGRLTDEQIQTLATFVVEFRG